jgi:ABC-2 type transport system permease protein
MSTIAPVRDASAPMLALAGSRANPLRSSSDRLSDLLRTLATAARIGWQTESNWTDPLLFGIYSVAKPIASVLILLFMLQVISGGNASPEYRAFVVVGSALWSFVIGGVAGLAWSLLDDRERYRMLKYLYLTPNSLLVVLLGRGAARLLIAAMGATITLGVGVLFLGIGFDPSRIDWPLLVPSIVLGFVAIVGLGIVLAAVCMQTRQESWSYPEAAAGALFLVSGVVFPLAVLPAIVQAIGLVTPLTWWIEGTRQALFPGGVSSVGGVGSLYAQLTGNTAPDPATIVAVLLASGAVATLAALAVFRASDRRAKDRGLLDRTTGS